MDLPKKILSKIKNCYFTNKKRKSSNITTNIKVVKVPFIAYSGLFFHKNLVKLIGFPKEEFVLYGDDSEWTYRITKNGGKIYIVFDSVLKDLESWWSLRKQSGIQLLNLLYTDSPFRLYYSIRNTTYFLRENFVSNYFIFRLNVELVKKFYGYLKY